MTSLNGVHELLEPQAGEVIEASTTEFTAQAVRLDGAPPFGAFVQVATDDGLTIVGVVAHVQTGGAAPCARANMPGHDGLSGDPLSSRNTGLPPRLLPTPPPPGA